MDKNGLNITDYIAELLIKDRKRDRLWRNVRFFLFLSILITWTIFIINPTNKKESSDVKSQPHVALVKLRGPITAEGDFSADRVMPILTRAFEDKNAKGVLIEISSGGGSAVQSFIIHDKIEQLKKKYNKKVVVLGVDALASGAYLIATAADKIYANNITLTGSIGVIYSGFGFTDAIKKLGITRRVFTAGSDKNQLDPFSEISDKSKQKIKSILQDIQANFTADVLASRKGKLKISNDKLFSGDVWTGEQAKTIGLIDGTGNIWDIMQKEFGTVKYKNYKLKNTLLENIANSFGANVNAKLSNMEASSVLAKM